MLEILYQDEYLVAINKPSGLLVHKSPIDHPIIKQSVEIEASVDNTFDGLFKIFGWEKITY